MSRFATIVCVAWIACALGAALFGALRGAREGTLALAAKRVRSPTVYLFSAYLLVAAFVTPRTPGETTSPLFWLAFALPVAYALASLASIAATRRSAGVSVALAFVHGGSVLAAAALILSVASPAFVPAWLR